MNTQLTRESIKSIAVLRALQLGDMLCSTPAFRELRKQFPAAHIALVGLPWAQEFVHRFQFYFDEFITFRGFPGLPEQTWKPQAVLHFLQTMQTRRFDLAIQMQGSGHHANECLALWGARQSAGFYVPGEFVPDPNTYLPYPTEIPEIHRHLRLLEFLGTGEPGNDALEFPLTTADLAAFSKLDQEHTLVGHSFVCIHPGGRSPARRWPLSNFIQIADALAARKYRVVLTGTEEERELTGQLAASMQYPAIDLAGRTSLGALAVMFERARLLVSNSTGVAHLACALKLPSIVIFQDCDARRWGPLDRSTHRIHLGEQTTIESVIADADDLLAAAAAA